MSENEHDGNPGKDEPDKLPHRRNAGDAHSKGNDVDPPTPGGQPQEEVEDRPAVSTVKPEDYPESDRAVSKPV